MPPFSNFGGILQAYALSNVLKTLGHQAEVIYLPINWSLPMYKRPWVWLKRAVKKFVFGKDEVVFFEEKLNRDLPVVTQHTGSFVDKYIPKRTFKSYYQISEKDYEAYVVGSDQIWRFQYLANPCNAFLDFTQDWSVKRIAYAASFGIDAWDYPDDKTTECSQLAQKFDAISVREESGLTLCDKYLHVGASWMPDPTLLLDKVDYEELFLHTDAPSHKGEMLVYILDKNEQTEKFVEDAERKLDKRSFHVNSHYEDFHAPTQERIQPSVESWLKGFHDADFVLTDSFHACVFSIIFNKPFYVLGNKERGMSRFHSLLSLFGLEDRLICDGRLPASINLASIDWDKINQKKAGLKNLGIRYLRDNLSK